MIYQIKDFSKLLGLKGFGDVLLNNHFTLYQGYITNTNKLVESLEVLLKANKAATPEYAELKRRFGWEFNGMCLHEFYFENLTKDNFELEEKSVLAQKITEDFGSFEAWLKDFKATGLMRGIGWVILYLDPLDKKLFNTWINEHDTGHLAGAIPLLVMDVFEHAYMLDYGLKKSDYMETFLSHINWAIVEKRYKKV